METVTPGYKSFGFYLTALANVLGALTVSGVVGDGSAANSAVGVGVALLASMGYAVSRAWAKSPDSKPNYKRTEFWLTCAAFVVGTVSTCGVFSAGGMPLKVLTGIGSLLAAGGYSYTKFLNAQSAGTYTLAPNVPLPPA